MPKTQTQWDIKTSPKRKLTGIRVFIHLFLLALLIAVPCAVQQLRAADSSPVKKADTDNSAKMDTSLVAAGDALTQGDFELARQCLSNLSSTDAQSSSGHYLRGLLGNYDQLMDKLLEARQEAYKKYLEKINDDVGRARWRKDILNTSLAVDLKAEEKTKFEEEQGEKIRDDWLGALVQLTASHRIAERMNLTEQVDPNLEQEIISRTLQIADHYEDQDKGLEAYSNVYGLLEMLDPQKYQYDDLHRRLLRQATLKALYVTDPNTEGVTWEERRAGVNFDIIRTAMATLSSYYVQKPDFKKMTERGLEYCLLLTETDELKKTFEQLKDESAVKVFRENVELLAEKTKEIEDDLFEYTHLLLILQNVVIINQQTLKLPDGIIMAEFTEGAFDAIDSYTYMIWPADVADFRKSMTNEFSGVGIVINKNKDGILQVDSLVSFDAPAYKAGLEANDLIIAVDGKDTKNITLEKAVHMITGPTGTEVVLSVERKGFDESRDFTVTRQHVVVPTVRGLYRERGGDWKYFVDPNDGIAYMRLTHFSAESPARLRQTLRKLKDKHMKALILDLRNNSGGFLSGAVDIVDTFVSNGRIVSSRYRPPTKEDVREASSLGTFDDKLPLVVLINAISASASEIVAGALKDHHRALIVGTRSFGKGNVQTINDLPNSTAQMKMTIAYYYLPSNRRVHRDPEDKTNKDYGVEPEINIELTASQIEKFLKAQHDAGVLHRDDLPLDEQKWKVYSVVEMLHSDPQLQIALWTLQARLWTQAHAPESERAFAAQKHQLQPAN